MSHERRVFFETNSDPAVGLEISLSDTDSHHVKNVLRLKAGQELIAVSRGSGAEFEAIVIETSRPTRIKLLSTHTRTRARSRVSCLAVALLKGSHNDQVCEKAAELSVETIIYWKAERSIPKLNSDTEIRAKLERWGRIAESAAKQSGQDFVTSVQYAKSIGETLKIMCNQGSAAGSGLFHCSLGPDALQPNSIIAPPETAQVLIGPEGDFSPIEEDAIKESGSTPITLGPLRLRAETAALAAVITLNSVWGFRTRQG